MMDAVRMVLAVNSPLDCKHNPIELDESPNTAAPSLVVCSLCGEVVEGEAHNPLSVYAKLGIAWAERDIALHRDMFDKEGKLLPSIKAVLG